MLDLLAGRAPTLGTGRLVCVDGPAGSGKTTFTAALAGRTGATVVRTDDLYDGWEGLDHVDGQLETLLRPMTSGRPGRYRRYDWHTGAFAETVRVEPAPLVVVDGVGSGSAAPDLVTVLVWVEAPRDLRLHRGLERDGHAVRAQWSAWQAAEDARFAREGTRSRADVVIDTTAGPGAGQPPPIRE